MADAVRNFMIYDNELFCLADQCTNELFLRRSCFLFRTISSADVKTKQFLRPLNIKVWYVVLSTMIVASSILIILIRQQEGIHSLSEACSICILFTIGAVSQQGTCQSLQSFSLIFCQFLNQMMHKK